MNKNRILLVVMSAFFSACTNLKVIHPDRPDTKGTLMVDYSGDSPKLVGTYTCTVLAANGQRIYATAKNEEDARKEAIAKCQGLTAVSFCNVSKMSCEKN